MTKAKTAVLLVNLGTPDEPTRGAVYRYLKQFLLDRRVIDYPWLARQLLVRGIIAPFRSGSSAKLYRQLWTPQGSPLKIYGEQLAAGLQDLLGDAYRVALAMRYQQPSIESAIQQLLSVPPARLIVLPLFPQYASATTGSVLDEVMRVLCRLEVIPPVQLIHSFYEEEGMIDVFVKNSQAFDLRAYDHVLFSYHGLPQRQLLKADTARHCLQRADCCHQITAHNQYCYAAQCYATSFAIAEKLGLKREQYSICFQSRLGPDAWTRPYTSELIEEQAAKGNRKLLVFCPAFVADCLETTIEIGHEYRELFLEKGGAQLDLVPSLNAEPDWIATVKDLVLRHA